MNAPDVRPEIPQATRAAAKKASNPAASAWVSANAGSGKTHVLVQRVLRLLLEGAPPSRILCLTFTKAAAANMAQRVFRTLAEWTALDDDALSRRIVDAGAERPNATQLNFARRLFARTIETPGGLKIQTIHAFCERLLHLFPFEANVAAGFRVVEDREAAQLMEIARAEALAHALDTPESAAALDAIARAAGPSGFDDLIREALNHRAEIAAAGDRRAHEAALRRRLGLRAGETIETILDAMVGAGAPREAWLEWAEQLDAGSANDKKRAANLRAASAATATAAALDACLDMFFDSKDAPRGGADRSIPTKPLAKRFPALAEQLRDEQDRLIALREKLRCAETVERSVALVAVAQQILFRYRRLKGARGLLDFDDLIARTLTLLSRADAAWVLFKLDSGIDHFLVDEAQDTSDSQWRILTKLSEDFLSGAGPRKGGRTLFAVGDEKQSIFSFQGAAPRMFAQMRSQFKKRHREADLEFEDVALHLSFRSSPAVLDVVDRVFAVTEVWRGVSASDEAPPPHQAFWAELPGLVEVWEPISATPAERSEDWRMPLDAASGDDPPVALARRIAGIIKSWLDDSSPERLFDARALGPRRITAGDVMILVRSRGAFFEAMIRALKENGVKAAGADRLMLNQHIAVMDLIAVGRAALSPDDDLTLACALKSPLIGLDDVALLELAPGRPASLDAALAASGEPRFAAARRSVARWRERARVLSPYAFYARILGEDGGRRAMLGRLGPEASDAIDEFMALALAHDQREAAALPVFLNEIETADIAIKRDMEASGDSVRVMTIHAAKGLEAPIVFLPDTCSSPGGRFDPKLLQLAPVGPGDAPLLAWATRADADPAALAEARQSARDESAGEYRRLLYVAMTRAAERLIVAGFEGSKKRPAECWYDFVRAGLDGALQPAPAPWGGPEQIGRLGAGMRGGGPAAKATPAPAVAAPAWLSRDAIAETAPASLRATPRRLALKVRPEAGGGLEIGRVSHALLQYLPDLPQERRAAAAQRFLEQRAAALSPEQRQAVAARVLGTIEVAALADLFGPNSRAEATIAANFTRPDGAVAPFSGRIDRIAVMPDVVTIADFKSGSAGKSGPPPAYVVQLALYRAAIAPLYPLRRLRAFLVWLDGPDVTELAPATLDEAFLNVLSET